MAVDQYYQKFLDNNRYPRELKKYDVALHQASALHINSNGKTLINFSSNDYLGLAKHPLLIQRSQEFAQRYGVGSASSRLVAGNFALYEELEEKIACAIGKPAALILGTGFQTNISVLEALLDVNVLGQEPLVFCDRLCHVSMLASTRFLARLQRFQHNDLTHLQQLLTKFADDPRPKFILVESIYSMDGDTADLAAIISLAKKYKAFFYVDDAHAVGVYGPGGWGKAAEFAKDIDLVMGTFSKALGSFGAYIACSNTLRDYLINKCKGLIYSTGLSPTILGAISAVIELLPQLDAERSRLLENAQLVREFFLQQGLLIGTADSHIVPWIIGDAEKTLLTSQTLADQGILGATIRPPTVPAGKCRIRFCLSAGHSERDLERLNHAIIIANSLPIYA